MVEKQRLSEDQIKAFRVIFDVAAGAWWVKFDEFGRQIESYQLLFSTLLTVATYGLLDKKYLELLASLEDELKEQQDSENFVFFNNEEMALMKALKWLLSETCEEQQAKIAFDDYAKLIKKRAFYRHWFGLLRSRIKSGELECHKSVRDLLRKAPW